MKLETIETDVLIVGAGPTGLTLANVLGQDDVRVALVDRKPGTIAEPRAVSIDDESLRTMQAVGLDAAVMQDVVPGYGVHYFTRVGGRCFGRVEPTASEYGFPRRNAFRQPLFEATVRAGLGRFGSVQQFFGHELETFTQNSEGVSAVVRRPDGTCIEIRAHYLAACDGGRSSVRELLGVKMVGSTFRSRWLVIDTDQDDDPFTQMRVYCDPRRPVVDVPGPHHTRRFEILVHPHESADDAMSPARVAEWLNPFRGKRRTHVVRKTVYTFHARVAERWQTARVFLAGDAAHLTPPYAGQGMNSGIRDAHNLGWKLSAVVRGRLPASALSSYEQERREHAWALIRLALNLGIVMAPSSRLSAWLWQAFFSAAAYIPPLRDYFLQMKFKPKPRFTKGLLGPADALGKASVRGRMLPQPSVTSDAGEIRLDTLIGPRFALVCYGPYDAEHMRLPTHALWSVLDAAKIWVLPSDDTDGRNCLSDRGWSVVVDFGNALRDSLASHIGRTIVLRPDRYAAGSYGAGEERQFADHFAASLGLVDVPDAQGAPVSLDGVASQPGVSR
ncbi:thi4 family protein [Burkholderia pseudomallei]|uniref:bifunctional 3-(3-hydroxy-phenyl)propionate/3-hydroxycinnamic acid hydroxylase n=1 Tax=Burkholderia pseudomallei TaxID=28450 RepID=UPI00052AB236|nr:bifunctional 3-(3-hydroxy-phenyl)propionate/3-hydroxycinnamic acid hydroxylase [Burkholderia pseudomallei]AIV75666.1 thi4 family protein [Burkholderia pseudomallei]